MNVHVTCGACGITYDQEVREVGVGLPLIPCCGACGSKEIDAAPVDPPTDKLSTNEKRRRIINLLRLLDREADAHEIETLNPAQVASGYRQIILAAKAAKTARSAQPDSATGAWGDIDRP